MHTFVHNTVVCISRDCAWSHREYNYCSEASLSFSNVFPSQTNHNPQTLQLNWSRFSISVINACTELSLLWPATHFLRGHLCVMVAGEALRYKSILASVLSLRGQVVVYFWSTYQSLTCLIFLLHLCFKCFTLLLSGADLSLLGREKKQRTAAMVCQEQKLPERTRQREREREGAGAFHYSAVFRCVLCVILCLRVCNRDMERYFQR